MGGIIKRPRRKKYIASTANKKVSSEEKINEEEHKRRLEILKSIGIIKDEKRDE